MKRPQRLLILTSLLVAVLVTPTIAEGHYKGAKEFYFDGRTRNKDPVNVFYYPWAIGKAVVDRHQAAHWPIDVPGDRECSNDADAQTRDGEIGDGSCDPLEAHRWYREEQISDAVSNVCKGSDELGFDRAGAGRNPFRNDFQSVGFTRENDEPGPEDCLTRYHTRMWDDEDHQRISANVHTGYEHWVVGPAHHEVFDAVDCGATFVPSPGGANGIPSCKLDGHDIDLDWDAVEFTFYQQMRRARSGHEDQDGIPGGHCAVYRWKPLPRSGGDFQGFDSDGWLTRISMNHCAGDPNTRE